MIKKISIAQLKVGMFVSDFNAGWLEHPFVLNSMLMESEVHLQKVRKAGIRELYIDTDKGMDVGDAPTAQEAEQVVRQEMERQTAGTAPANSGARVSLAEEMHRARNTFNEATRIIRALMEDARLGRQVDLASARPAVEKIAASVMRNSNALMTMRRLQHHDDHTFLHSVGVCTMLTTFGKVMNMEEQVLHDIALGGLIHDVGKMRVSMGVLNKPAQLSAEEYVHMKSHVTLGTDIMRRTPGIPPLALEPLEQHHERYDGSGYPRGLKGDEISQVGRMAAIVDVYDAITSNNLYRKAMTPAAAIQKMFEWSKFHFDPALTQIFVKSMGIYPVGSLVRLESGRLGVVLEQDEKNLLTPRLKVIYDSRRNYYIQPEVLDLSRPLGAGGGDRILSYEIPEKWGIDLSRFLEV